MTYIGVGRRFVAWFIDVMITALAWVPFAHVESGEGTFAISWRGWDFVLPLLITVAYFVLLEGLAGATVGKFVVGIRVRGLDGSRIGLGPALVRNLARVVDAFPYVIPYLVGGIVVNRSDTRQRLGDRWARTVVILMGTERDRGHRSRRVCVGRLRAPLAAARGSAGRCRRRVASTTTGLARHHREPWASSASRAVHRVPDP